MSIELGTALQAIAVLGIAGIFKQLWNLNGSVGRMQVWQTQHEKIDDERHQTVMKLVEETRQNQN